MDNPAKGMFSNKKWYGGIFIIIYSLVDKLYKLASQTKSAAFWLLIAFIFHCFCSAKGAHFDNQNHLATGARGTECNLHHLRS